MFCNLLQDENFNDFSSLAWYVFTDELVVFEVMLVNLPLNCLFLI